VVSEDSYERQSAAEYHEVERVEYDACDARYGATDGDGPGEQPDIHGISSSLITCETTVSGRLVAVYRLTSAPATEYTTHSSTRTTIRP
jgi:hypothetical protein